MIKRALLSVSDKTGLIPFAQSLQALGIELISTGGTAKTLRDAGLNVLDVSEVTGSAEMMDGRVKTLHPKIHGALLAKRDDATHVGAMKENGITPIDLVVINLYPFEQTVVSGANFDTCIENIDIGGPSMIRSAAKNHAAVSVVVDPLDYNWVLDALKKCGNTSEEDRRKLAAKAYARTAAYDSAIGAWFAKQQDDLFPASLTLHGTRAQVLHYGENPHQLAAFYTVGQDAGTLAGARLVQGSALSYNNLNDASAALELISEFEEPAVAIIKHANPCGVATARALTDAYAQAFACDPVSAYGGIIAINRTLDANFVNVISKLFVEVLIAPNATPDAIKTIESKKKLRLLLTDNMPDTKRPRMVIKTISGGFLYQQEDTVVLEPSKLKVVTQKKPNDQQMRDLQFAFTVAKHVKSNTIVLAKNQATIGIGAGQMSRIDSTRLARMKATEAGLSVNGAVLASDAFFPFSDNVELAAEMGIGAIIQPGGSIRDAEVIQAADKHGMAMVFTGMRHFRH